MDAPVRRHRRPRVHRSSPVQERRADTGAQGDAHRPVMAPSRSRRVLTNPECVGVVQEPDIGWTRPDARHQSASHIDSVETVELAHVAEEPNPPRVVEGTGNRHDPVRSASHRQAVGGGGKIVQQLRRGAVGVQPGGPERAGYQVPRVGAHQHRGHVGAADLEHRDRVVRHQADSALAPSSPPERSMTGGRHPGLRRYGDSSTRPSRRPRRQRSCSGRSRPRSRCCPSVERRARAGSSYWARPPHASTRSGHSWAGPGRRWSARTACRRRRADR